MKAITISEFGGIEKLKAAEIEKPKPADGELLIKIEYSSVNPVDWKIREGKLIKMMPHQFPIILGWDASGTVVEMGDGVDNFKLGDEVFVYCRKPTVQCGTYAEYVAVSAEHAALKPKNINHAQAAAIPLAGLTAWQALLEYARLKAGETILIQGGAGGVGSLAITLAKHIGAKIYTSASQSNHPYVKELGAEIAIDYNNENIIERIRGEEPEGLDVVFDCVGGQPLRDSYSLLKKGGRLVSIVERIDSEKNRPTADQYGVTPYYCFVQPNGQQLTKIAQHIEEGKIIPPKIVEMPLDEVTKAHEKSQQGHTSGKIVLRVS